MLVLLVACASPTPVLSATSSGGTWTVSVADVPLAVGLVEVPLDVADAGGAPAEGLAVTVRTSMEGMEMESDDVVVEATEGEAGVYAALLGFGMTGLWTLDVELSADAAAAETARLVVSVE